MNILLLYIEDNQDSQQLAQQYVELHSDHEIMMLPVTRNHVSDNWKDATHDSIQAIEMRHYDFPLVMDTPDLVILSMGFPITVYGNDFDNHDVWTLMYECQDACSLEHFISMITYVGAQVFRLDGSDDFDVMSDWLATVNDIERTVGDRTIVFDADSGLGQAYDAENDEFGIAREYMRSQGFPTILDETPKPAVLDGFFFDGWFGWYDKIPDEYFKEFFGHGAVGWQTRSTTFQHRDSDWCCSMIKAGFIGTIGACREPGIHAFPKPKDFCEAYFINGDTFGDAAWNSARDRRRLCFIGDPLCKYNTVQETPPPNPEPEPPLPPPPPVDPFDPPSEPPPSYLEEYKFNLADGKTLTITVSE